VLIPNIIRYLAVLDAMRARLAALSAHCALQAYRRENGRYPEKLEQLKTIGFEPDPSLTWDPATRKLLAKMERDRMAQTGLVDRVDSWVKPNFSSYTADGILLQL
jgi:hypothetical protein